MQHALRRFKADIFQALAHPTRIAIVELLRDGEVSAGVIFAQLGVEQANASQHLAVLRAKRIVVSRKVGNAVVRNRVRRRLREAARQVIPGRARPDLDYVLVGRQAAIARDFAALRQELLEALKRLKALAVATP